MSQKKIFISILAAIVMLAVGVAGCNRDSNRVAMRRSAPSANTSRNAARPAEVLSASAYRPPHVRTAMQAQPAPVMMAQTPAPVGYQQPSVRASQPYRQQQRSVQPAPVMAMVGPGQPYTSNVMYAPPVERSSYQTGAQQSPPVKAYVVHRAPQPREYHPTPDLAMARAMTPPAAMDNPVPHIVYRVPIPELEPSRYRRGPVPATSTRPAAEVMVSSGVLEHSRQEVQRALLPLEGQAMTQPMQVRGWVASPTTAMRTVQHW